MSAPDFSDLCPPACMTDEQLAGRWPEPITDRPPTEADADEHGFVQWLSGVGGYWRPCRWDLAIETGWRHSPIWRPKRLTEAQQIAAMLRQDGPLSTELLTRAAELLEAIQ